MRFIICGLIISLFVVSCDNLSASGFPEPTYEGPARTFVSSFESVADFDGFYIVPPGDYASFHELGTDYVHDLTFSHKAWILAARAQHNDGPVYLPHRAYPTVQFQKTPDGIYRTPCLVTLWVWLDMTLADRSPGIDDWFSFVTLSPDPSDTWSRTVLVNIVHDGYMHLMHVPGQGEQVCIFQADFENDPTGDLLFPFGEWVRLDVYIDFGAVAGYAKVWQNGELVSHALVAGGAGGLAQAHFGLYASAAVASGVIYNDRLRIIEVADETEAQALVAAPW